ncbi:hypothetical protein ACF0H5_002126 [Mactra antiquata]
MTCVLSISHLYQNPCAVYAEDNSDLSKKNCENYDFKWITPSHPAPGMGESNTLCASSCRVEASSSSVVDNISSGLMGQYKPEIVSEHTCEESNVSRQKVGTSEDFVTKPSNKYDSNIDDNVSVCDSKNALTSVYKYEPNERKMQQGVKRKSETYDIDHIPTKRISPFLNTPKERKDERKKVLKISLKKLRQLEDPETFLRRTVLVNNTMKRMQSELREEKYRSRRFESSRRKSFNGYNVLNNNCLSNAYLYDDPFLCGINEKITDDMTETLINNVFHDKSCDDSAISETANETKRQCADDAKSTQTAQPVLTEQSTQTTTSCSAQSSSKCTNSDTYEPSSRCEEVITSYTCKKCSLEGIRCNSCLGQYAAEPMQVNSSNTCVTISAYSNMSELDETKRNNVMECDRSLPLFDVHTTGEVNADSHAGNAVNSNVQFNKDLNDSNDDLNVDISDIEAIADNVYELQTVLGIDRNVKSDINVPFL